ncbi:MAG: MBOAT family protein [Crocinitomicaceae bacterium]|nr:MBOAT family protein [Crocinitomicaceae bacterium]
MVFSSSLFLLYFLPAFLVVYFVLGKFTALKNWWILIASIGFYAWGAPNFIFILLLSTIIDFYLVKQLYLADDQKRKRLFLIISLAINLGLLAFFKYANFFIDNVNDVLHALGIHRVAWTKIVLPIGISFYTFQTLTYSIDVYRGVHKPLAKLHNYLLYIMSFPQMIAGPIVRFNTIADQITDRREVIDDKLFGFYRFCIGLAKKVLISNVLGQLANEIMFLPANELTFMTSWIGILAYTFQIYFDFAGYSDMAIGLGKMMGFSFPENFNNPYNSRSITEFWRRWHMTLGDWMKNYLYIPLGGSKVNSKYKLFFNLWLVFLISGLWHGASWNFVIWGAFHGFFLILDRIFLKKLLDKLGTIPSVLFTFLVVVIGWVFFSIDNLDRAWNYLSKMFSFNGMEIIEMSNEAVAIFVLAAIISFACLTKVGRYLERFIYDEENVILGKQLMLTGFGCILFLLCVGAITGEGFNPFIYFRF